MATTQRPATKKSAAGAARRAARGAKSAAPRAKPASKVSGNATGAKRRPAQAVVRDAAKPAKPKLVRDSFTIPASEYADLDQLKQRAIGLARPSKKSELLRAGIKALSAMADAAFLSVLKSVPSIKTGRPKAHAVAGKGKAKGGDKKG